METKAERMMNAEALAKDNDCMFVVEKGEWNGYSVFEALEDDTNEIKYTGLPNFILCNDTETRFAEDNEIFSILKTL